MKGQQEILTPLLFTGILIAVVGSVYFWGVPLIQKNQDITVLHKAEDFMKSLNEKIIKVANTEGSDKITIAAGTLYFDPTPDPSLNTGTGKLVLKLTTKGTIYSTGQWIPFVRDTTCQPDSCIMGVHEPQLLFAQSTDIDGAYATDYTLSYRKLKSPQSTATSRINITGIKAAAGENHDVIIEFRGIKTGTDTVVNVEIRMQ